MFKYPSQSVSSLYLIISLVLVLALSGCKTLNELESDLFGPSYHDKFMADAERRKIEHQQFMADMERRNAENRSLMAGIDAAIEWYHQVASSIQLKQSKEDVLEVLLPTQVGLGEYGRMAESFTKDGKTIEIHYMRSARIQDGNTTDDEFTPYSFVDNTLIAIGWQALGGAKTYGDVNAAQRAKDAETQLLLGILGQQLQQLNPQQSLTSGCDTGHWVKKVVDSGRFVFLENGSVWEVSSIDRIDTTLWLPVTDITICDGNTLINTDDQEKVSARRLR